MDSQLQNILRQCTNEANTPKSDQHKELDRLWKEQEDRLSAHQKYLDQSIEIKPIPAFVIKAIMREKPSLPPSKPQATTKQKVFINICSHHLIPNPHLTSVNPRVDNVDSMAKLVKQGIRFPMSCGPQIPVKDNKGNQCPSFDVVLHPDVIKYCADYPGYREQVCNFAAQNICNKLGDDKIIIEGPYKFPKRVYKGIDENHKDPPPHRIRKTGAAKLIQEDGVANAKCIESPEQEQELIEEVIDPKKKFKMKPMEKRRYKYEDEFDRKTANTRRVDIDNKEDSECLKYDINIMSHDEKKKKLKVTDLDGLKKQFDNKEHKGFQIVVHLTERYKMKDVELDIGDDGMIKLNSYGKQIFKLKIDLFKNDVTLFNKMIDNVKAKFVTKKCLLKIVIMI